jgi:DNA polymerase-3 subunit alpha
MDCFGFDRGLLLSNVENIQFYSKQLKERELSKQDSLFSGTKISLDDKVTLKDAPSATMEDKLKWEKNLLGLYLSSHPFIEYEKELEGSITPLNKVEDYKRNEWIVVGGVVDKLAKKITKKGSIMMFVTLQDTSGSMELLVFPKTYEKTQNLWQEGALMCIVGKTPKEEGNNKIFVENVYPLTPGNVLQVKNSVKMSSSTKTEKELQKRLIISITADNLKEKGAGLNEIFASFPGDYQVLASVGTSIIKSHAMVRPCEDLLSAINSLVGEGSITIEDGGQAG